MEFCNEFDFEIEKVVKAIKTNDVRKVYIQSSEGFQRCLKLVIDRIRDLLDREIEIFISANPSYGSCLVDEFGAKDINADLIIHFGHTPYPNYSYSVKTLFIPVEYIQVNYVKLLEAIENLCQDDSHKICLATTPQHISMAKSICDNIKKCRCIYKGIILGCYPVVSEGCNELIVISGGKFHCIVQSLFESSYGKQTKILCLDPYNYNLWDPTKDVEKILRVRMWKMHQAIDAKNWLIIDGFYGQHREKLLSQLTEMFKVHNKYFTIVKVLKLDRDFLINMEANKNFDAIVIVSCPYLAFDFADFDKPVLTVGETFAILNNDINRYIYPW
uniref:2-(3-amino-3-carboxypropyl)histidine synthase n=1 Tax=Ignisphaera aggregans TaxID=334771 RepID=A0A7C5XNJ5_9CREN